MTDMQAQRILSALAQPTRFKTVAILAGKGSAGMASSDIADAVEVPRNLMSSHLAVLSRAEVLTSRRQGRVVTYVVNRTSLIQLAKYLNALAAAGGAES